KKFTEGWNCWRVSCMGLVNIGRKEGSQIIQLFGRGVRLKGLDFLLKRSTQLTENEHPKHVEELETLNIFGIRADYMKVFNEYIDEEDVTSAKKVEIIHLPTIENLARTDLKVILPKRDMPEFKREERPVFERCPKIQTTVSADWYGRLDSKTSRFRLHSDDEAQLNRTTLKPANLKFLDYDRLYLDLLHFKKQNAMYNLEISRDSIRALFEDEHGWYDLFIPEHMLEFTGFGRVHVWQEIAADLLKKYCLKFYRFRRDEFEGPHQEYRSIQEILDDPDKRYNHQFLQNLRIEYQAAIEKSQEQLIRDLKQIETRLSVGQLQDYAFGNLEIFRFAQHLYEPLIHVKKGTVGLSIKPASLNRHEKQFVDDLKRWCAREAEGVLGDRELYVLRNQSRGKGISFFDEGNFYPDFIIWLIDGDRQFITFADPHGLQHARGFSDSKVLFSKRIKVIESERLADKDVCLSAFILSPTPFSEIKHFDESFREHRDSACTKARFRDHHVLFMYDDADTYVGDMFALARLAEAR
ncbi:MAG: restriction endonuclease subunit R, partial [Lentisphaerae bacterium]|nr:restriction endonuclease subunit R [Lentisphaerota bacterium]